MYPKIQTVYIRDRETHFKTLLEGQYSLPIFEYLSGIDWDFTEKVDGTNVHLIWDGEHLKFAGRTDATQMHPTLIQALQDLGLSSKLPRVFGNVGATLYGEGYGPKIQKGGGRYRSDVGFVLFDIRDETGLWYSQEDVKGVADMLKIDIVPWVGSGTLVQMVDLARQGFNSEWGDFQAEGIVARPQIELTTRGGDRVITKIKCKDFVRT